MGVTEQGHQRLSGVKDLLRGARKRMLTFFLRTVSSMALYPPALLDPRVTAPSWWEESATVPALACPSLEEDAACDIAITPRFTSLAKTQ